MHSGGKIGGVYARIGGIFVFVELLNELEGEFCPIAKLFVAFHLQSGEIEETWRSFGAFFLRHLLHGEGRVFDGFEGRFGFFAVGESTFGEGFSVVFALGSVLWGFLLVIVGIESCGEGDIAVDGGEHPIGFGLEVLDVELSCHDHSQRGGLHAPDGEGLCSATSIIVAIFEGVESCGVHAQEPVADGSTESGFIESLIVLMGAEVGKSFADGFFGHGGNPESLHGTGGTGFLHHPSLYEFSLLSGVTAVDDTLGFGKELFDDVELFFDAFFESDAESLGHHRECGECPCFPVGRIFFGIFEFTEVSKCPRHLVAVTFVVSGISSHSVVVCCSNDFGNVSGNGGFLGNTNYHFRR